MNQELHNWREGKIGASDAPIIMQVAPSHWKTNTPYKLWEEKVFGVKRATTSAMNRGNSLEPKAIEWFEKKIGLKLNSQQKLTHREIPYMIATIDCIDESGVIMAEIKCPNKEDHSIALNKKVPEHYMPQLQHQMEVAGLNSMYYVSFDGIDGAIVEVEKDNEYIDKILKSERSFYECMINISPPPLTERDYEEKGEDWVKLAQKRWKISEEIKALEKESKALTDLLISLSEDKNCRGGGFQFSKITVKGRVDYEAIPELKNIDVEIYRKNSSIQWRLNAIK